MQRDSTSNKRRREPSIHDSEDDDQSSMGRWTKEEHNKFIDGLRKYGKNWKLIEDYVNTRSGSQIRSHAQKFFSRLEKQCNISKGDVFKYLDKLSNDLLEFNSENEMLRKRKIWEVIKASNNDNCRLG
jgi:SHAQKYF class myb-like DNA-binding protein